MSEQNNEKPCLVETGRGFSVSYKNRFLYSKYDPSKAVLQSVSAASVLPGTLILACSPCLCYGLKELCDSLPDGCFVLGCERDAVLCDFARIHLPVSLSRFFLVSPEKLSELPLSICGGASCPSTLFGRDFPQRGTFRRVIRIDFSAGVRFSPAFYAELSRACEESIAQFWKNRITLVRLGRKYSRNLMRNLARLPLCRPLGSLMHGISRPVAVFGAGESLEQTARGLLPFRKQFYVIAADAALSPLLSLGMTPDAVVCQESQSVIARAFIGIGGSSFTLFCDMTSWPGAFSLLPRCNDVCCFSCRYDDTVFFSRLGKYRILPPEISALGSVGLSAVQIALLLRSSDTVPVFVSGLDFSYTPGVTHVRGAPARIALLASSSRTMPPLACGASFSEGSLSVPSKDGKQVFTIPSLLSYAHLFQSYFSGIPSLYDSGKSGIPLGIPCSSDFSGACASASAGNTGGTFPVSDYEIRKDTELAGRIASFYDEEEKALLELKEILSRGQNMDEAERNKKIMDLLSGREYLYLHFPDGYRLSSAPSFLKRVRAEIDFFLKDISVGRKLLA